MFLADLNESKIEIVIYITYMGIHIGIQYI